MSQQHTVVPAREIVRHYQRIFKQVTEQNQPVILATKQGDKVALISLQSLEEFTRLKEEASGQALLSLSQAARKLTTEKELPTDLSTRHDAYLWDQTD
jgi:5'-deoxynucleotidase YfbR-like HD superfamily hydrolase